MYFSVVEANHLGSYRIDLRFQDGSKGIADLSGLVNQNNVFSAFQNANYFARFRVENGTLVWGDGELDVAPEALYEMATGKPVHFRGGQKAAS